MVVGFPKPKNSVLLVPFWAKKCGSNWAIAQNPGSQWARHRHDGRRRGRASGLRVYRPIDCSGAADGEQYGGTGQGPR